MPRTVINLTINLRKLGQISSPFSILYFVRRRDKEASNVGCIISIHLAASFRLTRSNVVQNDVISHFLADKGRKKLEKVLHIIHNIVIS